MNSPAVRRGEAHPLSGGLLRQERGWGQPSFQGNGKPADFNQHFPFQPTNTYRIPVKGLATVLCAWGPGGLRQGHSLEALPHVSKALQEAGAPDHGRQNRECCVSPRGGRICRGSSRINRFVLAKRKGSQTEGTGEEEGGGQCMVCLESD